MNFLKTAIETVLRQGLSVTIRNLPTTLQILAREQSLKGLFRKQISVEERFTWIYNTNHWMSNQSVSGSGSTLNYTQNVRKELPALIQKLEVNSVFDAPCGDFNWMALVVAEAKVSYTGADIVAPLIENLQRTRGAPNVRFLHLNLIEEPHPRADLMICRDLLFHLSFSDAFSVLRKFVESGSSYILTTTHVFEHGEQNRDIETGDFRIIDLLAPPFGLPKENLGVIMDYLPPDPKRMMILWSNEQISKHLAGWTEKTG